MHKIREEMPAVVSNSANAAFNEIFSFFMDKKQEGLFYSDEYSCCLCESLGAVIVLLAEALAHHMKNGDCTTDMRDTIFAQVFDALQGNSENIEFFMMNHPESIN